jgi:hypothetical protein
MRPKKTESLLLLVALGVVRLIGKYYNILHESALLE